MEYCKTQLQISILHLQMSCFGDLEHTVRQSTHRVSCSASMLAAMRERMAHKSVQLHEGELYPARLLAGDSAGGM